MGKGRVSSLIYECKKCGEKFHPWRQETKYCSRMCSPTGKEPTIQDLKCEVCGVIFRPTSSKRGKFCSRDCYRNSGTRVKNNGGYILIYKKDHPAAYPSGQVLEHRIVMEDALKRYLHKDENVHHINGIKDDNRLENLELWTTHQPKGQRIQDQIAWAKEILERYEGVNI